MVPPKSASTALNGSHADSASARQIGSITRRETGRGNNAQELPEIERLILADPPQSPGAHGDFLHIDAAAIVLDLDSDNIACRRCPEPDNAGFRFARGSALFYGFESVADRISDKMEKRVHHPLDDNLIDLGILSVNPDLDALVQFAFKPPRDKPHPFEHLTDRHHAHADNAFTQFPELPLH